MCENSEQSAPSSEPNLKDVMNKLEEMEKKTLSKKDFKKEIKLLERKIKELESNQRSADSILRNVVQGNGRRIEKAPYELEGHGFVEEIKDYY